VPDVLTAAAAAPTAKTTVAVYRRHIESLLHLPPPRLVNILARSCCSRGNFQW
jgi:hypothetical protein